MFVSSDLCSVDFEGVYLVEAAALLRHDVSHVLKVGKVFKGLKEVAQLVFWCGL